MLNSLILRPEHTNDATAIDHLINAYNLTRNDGDQVLAVVAEADDILAGYIVFSEINSKVYLSSLVVSPSFYNKKIAQHLIAAGMAGLKKKSLIFNALLPIEELYFSPEFKQQQGV
ncbi:hypothetical protein AwWohl_03470 [Gammaproteobacteria bacterium]|nr:hypothetical protein AwWohl_03470 [Gammaproteobacteria bacterium]